MKKPYVLLALGMLLASLLAVPVRAKTVIPATTTAMEKKASEATTAMEQKDETETVSIDYALPYPGILSDHPLYFLKKFRDWIVERLIADPAKKIEFYVRQSDKMLNSAVFLVERTKQSLADEMLDLSSGYMENAVRSATSLKERGGQVPGYMLDIMEKSLAKHEEVLGELSSKVADSQKEALSRALELVRKLQEEVAKLR